MLKLISGGKGEGWGGWVRHLSINPLRSMLQLLARGIEPVKCSNPSVFAAGWVGGNPWVEPVGTSLQNRFF
jgi:hypothetical protein